MNRRKKIKKVLKSRDKKARAKLSPKKKSTYVSKADRAKLAEEAIQEVTVEIEDNQVDS